MGGKQTLQAGRGPAAKHIRGGHDRRGFWRDSFRKSERGQDLAEFAIVLPLLFLILYGVLDLGRLFHDAIAVTGAAREGARFATIYPDASVTQIGNAARNEALNSGVNLGASAVSVSCSDTSPADGTCDSGIPVEVRVTHNFNLLLGGLLPLPGIQLSYAAEMMVP